LILFSAFQVAPVLYALGTSFFNVNRSGLGFGGGELVFSGFDNYARVFADPLFWESIGRVLFLGAIQVPVMLGIATVLALLLDSGLAPWIRFFRTSFFLPYAVPGVLSVLLWSFFYIPGVSPINELLGAIGINGLNLLSSEWILFSIGNITTWQYVGYNMIIIFTALQAIPRELGEAAAIDGAGRLRLAISIKLPILAPALILTTALSIIGILQLFSEPAILSGISRGSINQSFTPNYYAYNITFNSGLTNLGAAQAVVLSLVAGALSFAFLRATIKGLSQ
jgi:multiple sugar transport system permease protein